MASPYMTKDRLRDTMLTIDSLAHYLEMFLGLKILKLWNL